MNRSSTTLLTLVVALSFAGFANAQLLPNNYCENITGSTDHYYAFAPQGGIYAFAPTSGNLTGDCDGDPTTVVDSDGHYEYAQGGAVLFFGGNNQALCFDGVLSDHAGHATVTATETSGLPVGAPSFILGSDVSHVPGSTSPDCGDGIIDPCDDPSEIPGVTCTAGDALQYSSPDFLATGNSISATSTVPVGINGTVIVFICTGTDGIPQVSGTISTS